MNEYIRPSRCNLVTNRGDAVVGTMCEVGSTVGVSPVTNDWTYDLDNKFGFPGWQAPVQTRGMFGVIPVGPGGIHDGLSNTMGVSEAVVSNGVSDRSIKGGAAYQENFQWEVPQVCLAVRNGSQIDQGVTPVEFPIRGGAWSAGEPGFTGYTCSTPPNSPSCVGTMDGSKEGFFPASSNHTGGVNVGIMDGSVTFVSDTVNCEGRDQRLVGTRDWLNFNKSPHGVWGSLSTRNCGESVAIP